MKILHLSETTLSGAPYRLSQLYNKYSGNSSRHIVWKRVILNRVFPVDMVGEDMDPDELRTWLDWPDIIHYHNVYTKLSILKSLGVTPKKPSLIQIHSPRDWFDANSVIESKLPIAVIAQYHVRQWPELTYIVPNVVDINEIRPIEKNNKIPIVSYAPSNGNGKGWNDKAYGVIVPALRRHPGITFQKIFSKPFVECMRLKQSADIGIDDINTGSYHLSALEYTALGCATICYTDPLTEKVLKDLTGCSDMPWIHNGPKNILAPLHKALRNYKELGAHARSWMERYWDQSTLCDHYTRIYNSLV